MAKTRAAKAKDNATYREHLAALEQAAEALPHALAVVGDEAFLRQEALETLQGAFTERHPGAEQLVLRGGVPGGGVADTLKTAVMELGGLGLFASEKLVLFRQADRALFPVAGGAAAGSPDDAGEGGGAEAAASARGGSGSDPEERFLSAMRRPDPGLWCWLELGGLPRNRKFGKSLAEAVTVVPCPTLRYQRDQDAWLRNRARKLGKTIEPEAVGLLLSIHGGRLGALAAELEKLAVHAGDEPTITVAAAQLFFAGTRELDAFGLSNAVEARDFPAALDFARRIGDQGLRDEKGKLVDGEGSARRALHLLSGSFEALFTARVLRDRREDMSAFQAACGLAPYRAERLWNAARNYSPGELRLALDRLAEAARAVNDTGGDIRLALETAMVAIVLRK